jgi:capsular polysaccharide biosynthesis protein
MKKLALVLGILFLALGVLTPLGTTLAAFLLPASFASSTKILHAANGPSSLTVAVGKIVSQTSLDRVIRELDLGAVWARKYKQPDNLSSVRCAEMLTRMITIVQPRNSAVIEIKVRSDNKDEAALIANKITAVYLAVTPGATIIAQAQPNPRPMRPNRKLNLVVGLNVGAALAAAGVLLLIFARRREPDAAASR